MGHVIQGFIAQSELIIKRANHLKHAHVASLEQGFGFLPLIEELRTEVANLRIEAWARRRKRQWHFASFEKLTLALEQFGMNISIQGTAAYLETEYFAGEGQQAAILWKNGTVWLGPLHDCALGPINTVLRRMGVDRQNHFDEFAALGLGRYRSNEAWVDQPVYGKRIQTDEEGPRP